MMHALIGSADLQLTLNDVDDPPDPNLCNAGVDSNTIRDDLKNNGEPLYTVQKALDSDVMSLMFSFGTN